MAPLNVFITAFPTNLFSRESGQSSPVDTDQQGESKEVRRQLFELTEGFCLRCVAVSLLLPAVAILGQLFEDVSLGDPHEQNGLI